MTIKEIESDIEVKFEKIPLQERRKFLKRLAQKLEDDRDREIVRQRDENPDFIPYEEFRKELFNT